MIENTTSNNHSAFETNISRRDLYAAAALIGILAWQKADSVGGRDQCNLLAAIAFDFADAMLLKANADSSDGPSFSGPSELQL